MAYGKLTEGDRCYDAADDAGIYYEDLNEVQDQTAAMLGPREIGVLSSGTNGTGNSAWNAWQYNENPAYWTNTAENSAVLIVPVSLYVGQKITSVHCTVSGATGSLGGSCMFLHGNHAAISTVDLDGVTNCWDTGGTGTTVNYSDTGDITVTTGHTYYFYFGAGTNATTHACRIQKAHVVAQFGN